MEWLRWYNGTASDPKWRAISRKTGQPIAAVLAVWVAICENANQSPVRGSLDNWCSEDVAAALDLDVEQVEEITAAMQGKVLSDSVLTGWEKRNPKREDPTAADRKRRQRRKDPSRDVTQSHAPEEDREIESEGDTDTSSIIKLHADDPREKLVDAIMIAANRGMMDNPKIGNACCPIPIGHGSRQEVMDWLDGGVDPEVARAAVYQRAKEYQPDGRNRQPNSLRYFNGVVKDAHEKRRANLIEVPNGSRGLPGNVGARAETGGGTPARRDKYAAHVEDSSAA